jgi:hypothetical protein
MQPVDRSKNNMIYDVATSHLNKLRVAVLAKDQPERHRVCWLVLVEGVDRHWREVFGDSDGNFCETRTLASTIVLRYGTL